MGCVRKKRWLLPFKEGDRMPAARPSQASVSNAVSAVVALGLQPKSILVGPDGSFRVEIAALADTGGLDPMTEGGDNPEPLSWEDAA